MSSSSRVCRTEVPYDRVGYGGLSSSFPPNLKVVSPRLNVNHQHMDGHPPDIQTPDPVGVGNGGSNGYMALFGDHIYAGGSHGVDLSGTKEEAFSSTTIMRESLARQLLST